MKVVFKTPEYRNIPMTLYTNMPMEYINITSLKTGITSIQLLTIILYLTLLIRKSLTLKHFKIQKHPQIKYKEKLETTSLSIYEEGCKNSILDVTIIPTLDMSSVLFKNSHIDRLSTLYLKNNSRRKIRV